jgi:DnaJ-class molecular chaperone
MKCVYCDGDGEILDDIIDGRIEITYPCGICNGTGEVNIFRWFLGRKIQKEEAPKRKPAEK